MMGGGGGLCRVFVYTTSSTMYSIFCGWALSEWGLNGHHFGLVLKQTAVAERESMTTK